MGEAGGARDGWGGDASTVFAGSKPGFPRGIRPTSLKTAEMLAELQIPSFTRRVRQIWLSGRP